MLAVLRQLGDGDGDEVEVEEASDAKLRDWVAGRWSTWLTFSVLLGGTCSSSESALAQLWAQCGAVLGAWAFRWWALPFLLLPRDPLPLPRQS